MGNMSDEALQHKYVQSFFVVKWFAALLWLVDFMLS